MHIINYCNAAIFAFHFMFVFCPVIPKLIPTVLALVARSTITSSGTPLLTSYRTILQSNSSSDLCLYSGITVIECKKNFRPL